MTNGDFKMMTPYEMYQDFAFKVRMFLQGLVFFASALVYTKSDFDPFFIQCSYAAVAAGTLILFQMIWSKLIGMICRMIKYEVTGKMDVKLENSFYFILPATTLATYVGLQLFAWIGIKIDMPISNIVEVTNVFVVTSIIATFVAGFIKLEGKTLINYK